jgi:hypothetical protein
MCIFTSLYLKTTNPQLTSKEFFSPLLIIEMLLSVLFHTALYTGFFNLVNYIYYGRLLSLTINKRMIISLIIIMIVGFYGRFLHVKDVYKAYNYNMEKTRKHLDTLYIGWIFVS